MDKNYENIRNTLIELDKKVLLDKKMYNMLFVFDNSIAYDIDLLNDKRLQDKTLKCLEFELKDIMIILNHYLDKKILTIFSIVYTILNNLYNHIKEYKEISKKQYDSYFSILSYLNDTINNIDSGVI